MNLRKWPGIGPPLTVATVLAAIAVMTLVPALTCNANQSHSSFVAAMSGAASLPDVAIPYATLANDNCAIGPTTQTAPTTTSALIGTSPPAVSANANIANTSATRATATATLTEGGNCCGAGLTAGVSFYGVNSATATARLTEGGNCCGAGLTASGFSDCLSLTAS